MKVFIELYATMCQEIERDAIWKLINSSILEFKYICTSKSRRWQLVCRKFKHSWILKSRFIKISTTLGTGISNFKHILKSYYDS
ncbi:hypothetical protein QLX08_006576 [Tetragonisca angustula]|uniref:Uncharacterized protein n=1 Tax=Tetragonisca angustula TaxID=166442 RepID=A0AAW0ZT02_9HYME